MILFDIDGTLLLTGGAGKIAFEKAFKDLFGIANAWGAMVPDGKTDPMIFQGIASETLGRRLRNKESKQLYERYLTHFNSESGSVLFDAGSRRVSQIFSGAEKYHYGPCDWKL